MSLVCKREGDQQSVYGEVYAPSRPDAQAEFMRREEIQKMAHAFLRSGKLDQIDVLHDNKVVKGCHIVESFIARDDDKEFLPGSWVVGVHVPEEALWSKIKKGEINGFLDGSAGGPPRAGSRDPSGRDWADFQEP